MNNIPIVFTFDKRIIPAASVAIKSLIQNAADSTYEIHIMHYDIELKYQREINELIKNTNHTICFHLINPSIFKGLKKSKGSWSEIVYYRLLIPEILRNYDKVIYSDVDVFFKDDLKEIYNLNIDNFELGAVRAEKNTQNAIGHKYFSENKNEFIFWSGFLLLNCKKLREENYFEKFINTARTFNERLKYFDLDVMNITCNNIYPISLDYCVLETIYSFDDFTKAPEYAFLKEVYSDEEIKKAKQEPKIIHYAGKLGKPWRRKNPPKYYKEYLDSLNKTLKKFTFRDIRKKFFDKSKK